MLTLVKGTNREIGKGLWGFKKGTMKVIQYRGEQRKKVNKETIYPV